MGILWSSGSAALADGRCGVMTVDGMMRQEGRCERSVGIVGLTWTYKRDMGKEVATGKGIYSDGVVGGTELYGTVGVRNTG